MDLKLPVAIHGPSKATDAVVKEPTPGVIADTKRAVDAGNPYKAIQLFVAGCCERIGAAAERRDVLAMVAAMPFKTAEYVVAKVSLLMSGDDGLEGVYRCPRCGKNVVCEKTEDSDSRDRFDSLDVVETEERFFRVELTEPVRLHESPEEQGAVVSSVTVAYPTLGNCAAAHARIGDKDSMRLQFAIYAEALVGVNDAEVDQKWRTRWGSILFEKMRLDDLRVVGKAADSVGVKTEVAKACPWCGKVFKTTLNALDFFASALQ